MSSMYFRAFDFRKTDQPALHFFDCNTGISAPELIGLNARLRTVQQLFRPEAGNDDETKP